MTLSIYIILSWLLLGLFIFEKKSIGNKAIAFTLMLGIFLNSHIFLIISEPIKLLEVSHNEVDYISFIIYRSFLTPLLIVYIINWIFMKNKARNLVIMFGLAIFFFWLLEIFNLKQGLINYEGWSTFYTLSYLSSVLLVCYFFVIWFKKKGWA